MCIDSNVFYIHPQGESFFMAECKSVPVSAGNRGYIPAHGKTSNDHAQCVARTKF